MQHVALPLNGITTRNRVAVTENIRTALDEAGGWITDYHPFADLSACISFEIAPEHVPDLREKLHETGVRLDEASEAILSGYSSPPGRGSEELTGTLELLFLGEQPRV